jgi:hypothetical protein
MFGVVSYRSPNLILCSFVMFLFLLILLPFGEASWPRYTVYDGNFKSADLFVNFTASCENEGALVRLQYENLVVTESVEQILLESCNRPFPFFHGSPVGNVAIGRLRKNLHIDVPVIGNDIYIRISNLQNLTEFSVEYQAHPNHSPTQDFCERNRNWGVILKKDRYIYMSETKVIGPIC